MPVPLGANGQADFTQPIELMKDCHRRIEHFLEVLCKVVDRYGTCGLDDEGRGALDTALNYFRQAAPRHTADEERSLFPRMRNSDDPEVRAAMTELDRLEADHRQAQIAHDRVDRIGRDWLDTGRLDRGARTELSVLLRELTSTYVEHIRLEDETVFVLASRALDAQSLAEVGREMQRRRIEAPGRSGSRCAQRRLRLSL